MQSADIASQPEYVVSLAGETRHGSAQSILQTIKNDAGNDSALSKLSLDDYASVLVKDSPYFLSRDDLKFLNRQKYESNYDKALQYLAAMPSSGLRILSKRA